ncbi:MULTISPECIES: hypothetical protein [Flavobacterium]|nr:MULTISPECIES: hypothetical protein [Flavobacterium]MBB6388937.1 hypothetical protein [Flavobacterium notoginsengisoli]
MKVKTFDEPVLIPEDLIFCDLRQETTFIKEPTKCIDFTDIERLIIQSEFNDISLIKDADFRLQNTYMTSLCQVDPRLLTVNIVTAQRAYTIDIEQEVMDRVYGCSGDIGVTMHIIDADGIQHDFTPLSYLDMKYDNDLNYYYFECPLPFSISKVWFSDNHGHFNDSNKMEFVP